MAEQSGYFHVLVDYFNRRNFEEITITRANAPNLKGKLKGVTSIGCWIVKKNTDDSILKTFVAYEDIRGVSHVDWDVDNLG